MKQIIQIEKEDFYSLIEEVVNRIREKNDVRHDKWVDASKAMSLLQVSSRTTLQRFRNEGLIKYSQPTKKIILYDRDSIEQFIEDNAKETF